MLLNVLTFVFVLGLLIFFHEFGHFLAAKACGIYVDRFSLGFPPRIWGLKIGDTDYCVGALPLGGYVKMAGQEDTPMDEEQRQKEYGHVPPERWFNNKPVWQRYIVIGAGPFMNVVLAVILYAIASAVGERVPEETMNTRIGFVESNSPAAQAPLYKIISTAANVDTTAKPDATGWRPGDRILSINGRKVSMFQDVAVDSLLSSGALQKVVIERSNDHGGFTKYLSPIKPRKLSGSNHWQFGIAPFHTAVIASVSKGLPAQKNGLKKGDIITKLNGHPIDSATFTQRVSKLTHGESISVAVLRDGKTLDLTLHPVTIGRINDLIFTVTYADPLTPASAPLVVAAVGDKLHAKTGLRSGDTIEDFNGQHADVGLLRRLAKTAAGTTVTATIRRPARLDGLLGTKRTFKVKLDFTPVGFVGIIWGQQLVFHRTPLDQVLPVSLKRCGRALHITVRTLELLITGGVSPKEISGPVGIYEITTMAAHEGLMQLVRITAFISVNLAILNILPLPVLDGGLLVFLTIEGIRRKPLDVHVLERIQQVGIALLICIMLFVTYNDIARWFADTMR